MEKILLFALLLGWNLSGQDRQFPTWRPEATSTFSLWQSSPIIAVGEVDHMSEFGVQTVGRLPVAQDLHRLYWCQADFHAIAFIKGEEESLPTKYLWGSVNPGCRLFYGSRASYEKNLTRVWFLRAEGSFLRPQSDGAALSYGLLARWDDAHGPARERFGTLLLTPDANTEDLGDYADVLWTDADFACALLGKERCVDRINRLAQLGNDRLKEAACQYLKAQQGEICKSP
jgi:hypothetical protein